MFWVQCENARLDEVEKEEPYCRMASKTIADRAVTPVVTRRRFLEMVVGDVIVLLSLGKSSIAFRRGYCSEEKSIDIQEKNF